MEGKQSRQDKDPAAKKAVMKTVRRVQESLSPSNSDKMERIIRRVGPG
jgi:hypothetical protein